MATKDQQDLMILAAWLYYDEQFTQKQIAEKLGLSRISVTRLLQRARQEGAVEIRMKKPLPLQYQLSLQLQKRYGLKNIVIAKTYEAQEDTLNAVGEAAAEYLAGVVSPGSRLGIVGWSKTLSYMAPYLKAMNGIVRPAVVSELVGSFVGKAETYNVSLQVAEALGVPIDMLPVPAMVRSEAARDAILAEPAISNALKHARQCDVIFVGVGHVGPGWTMVTRGHLSEEEADYIRNKGAVGDILGRYYDECGRTVSTYLDSRIFSLSWEDLHRIPHIVAVACGPHKVKPILGLLRGSLCHCLVSDIETAQQVLQSESDQERKGLSPAAEWTSPE